MDHFKYSILKLGKEINLKEDQDGKVVFYFIKFFLLLRTKTKKITASSRRVDSREVISEVEASNSM